MKNKKYIKRILIILVLISITCSGCFKRDEMEDINIITTIYPLEYVLNKLYGDNAVINSIYPDGITISEYKITSKQYKDFSNQDLFVYNGLSSDKDIALKLINKNKDILIMDSNYGMEIESGTEELWLNPSNLLMISQNIKNGLIELIDSKYIKEEINENYKKLKVELSELDAEIKLLGEDASKKTIITTSPSLNFLSKYGFTIILTNDDEDNKKNIADAINAINNKETSYIYTLENEKESNALKKIKKETKVKVIELDKIDNMTDEQRDNKENYVTLMKDNLELLKKGTE